jgi:hypothetical protein
MRARRFWIAGFIGVLALFGFGQLEAWPFTSWYMFSHIEPSVVRVASVVALSPDGAERRLGPETLPLGLLSHRLLQRLERAGPEERAALCGAVLTAARSRRSVAEVRVVEQSWRALDRAGDRPANVITRVVAVCR